MLFRSIHQPEGSVSTRCYQLRNTVMKDTVGVGLELRHIYFPGRRSHHPNNAPRQNYPNPNFHAERRKRGPPSLLPPEQQAEEEGTSPFVGGDRGRKKELLPCLAARSGTKLHKRPRCIYVMQLISNNNKYCMALEKIL